MCSPEKSQRRKNKPWVTTEIMDLSYKRREHVHIENSSQDCITKYHKAHMEVRKKMKKSPRRSGLRSDV
ncbi:hypothetical protein DPMN_120007 [Dreissena polymorpha]|uniref:Uncharacterized protein n=1 Tax=Dreissena polymorpha TaxID=45954 RepID=A0A9D4GKA3_DREPO|nr:hypothetical protein DPMN_120007 [Dreissena polymorpha]